MQLGMIGLGRMGGNMVKRLALGGHQVVVYDRDESAVKSLASEHNVVGAASLDDMVKKLKAPRAVWVMVPCGAPTEQTVQALAKLMQKGDTIIDGGNSNFHDDARRAGELKAKGLNYVDAGTSGGIWGLKLGYCMMIGGDPAVVKRLDPIFATLAPGADPGIKPKTTAERGYLYCGPAGSGHFVKMIHNGIEYGMMQAYAEGFEIMQKAGSDAAKKNWGFSYGLDLAAIAEVWRHGSVVRSWLLDLTADALKDDPKLSKFPGYVEDSGEGRWTVQAAIDADVPAPVLTQSLYTRFRSRQERAFAEQVLSAMRFGFGGHRFEKPSDKPASGAGKPAAKPSSKPRAKSK